MVLSVAVAAVVIVREVRRWVGWYVRRWKRGVGAAGVVDFKDVGGVFDDPIGDCYVAPGAAG